MGKTKNDYKKLHEQVIIYMEENPNHKIMVAFESIAKSNKVSTHLVKSAYYAIENSI